MHSAAPQAESEEDDNDDMGEAAAAAAAAALSLPPFLSYAALDDVKKGKYPFDMYLRDFAGQCKGIAAGSAFFRSACRVAEQPQTTTWKEEEGTWMTKIHHLTSS